MQLDQMYQEIILDHYRAPHRSGLREPFDAESFQINPTCGDEITLRVALDGDTVSDVSYETLGCSISQASASVLTDLVVGRSVTDSMKVLAAFQEMAQGRGQVVPDEDVLGEDVVRGAAGMPEPPAPAGAPVLDDIEEAMRDVVDPELGINVVDLGLVYGIATEGGVATIDMTLTSAACPLTDVIEEQTRSALTGEANGRLVDDIKINWVWMPPWG